MRKRIESNGIAMLVDLDDCMGCYGCEAACRDTNRYGYDEFWLKVIRRQPWLVDGKLRQYHIPAPCLDKCATCYEEQDHNPLCMSGCPTLALKVGPVEDIIAESKGRHCIMYTA